MLAEQEKLRVVHAQLQHKITEYLARKKVWFREQLLSIIPVLTVLLQTEERPDPGRNVTDQEQRYHKCMGEWSSLSGSRLYHTQRALSVPLYTLRGTGPASVRDDCAGGRVCGRGAPAEATEAGETGQSRQGQASSVLMYSHLRTFVAEVVHLCTWFFRAEFEAYVREKAESALDSRTGRKLSPQVCYV